jgi:hypothetical protein
MNKKTHCVRGHAFPESKDGSGKCRLCRNFRWSVRRQNNSPGCLRDRARRRTPEARYKVLLVNAKVRNLEVTLTFEKFQQLISFRCYYCQESLPETGSGIDRVDPNIGYVEGNCRPCCSECNQAKSDKTEDQFREWILRVYNNWIKA